MVRHEPVMVAEVKAILAPERGGVYVDCTVGLGGHAKALLASGATRLIGLDRDAEALAFAEEALSPWRDRVELVHADYRDLPSVLDARGVGTVDGALADLGVSSMQLDAERGFTFRRDEPLDMRMDRSRGQTAAELLQRADERTIADVIFQFGEERFSRRIARAVVRERAESPIATTGRLAEIVRRAMPRRGYSRIDPATRTFQALRIWVNRELEGLDEFVLCAARRLARGGRVAVIAFHSIEDRIVKHAMRAIERGGEVAVRILTKKPIEPGEAEIERNPRARSAKLRGLERLAVGHA